jgi:hypothetical protein
VISIEGNFVLAENSPFMISGFDLTVYMPSLENFMNCEELKTAGLTDNPTFQFLLRAGYEQILRTQNGMEIEI